MAEATVTAGAVGTTDDWEFAPDVVNTYRAGLNQEIVDTFTRTVSSSWGDADTGQTWSGSGSSYSTDGSKALVTHSSANTTIVQTLATPTNVADSTLNVVASVSPATLTGGAMKTNLRIRVVDSSNFYRLALQWATDGSLATSLDIVVAGVSIGTNQVSANLAITHSGSATQLRLKFQADGQALRAKIWKSTDVEPTTWTLETSDPTFTAGGYAVESVRVTGNTNSNAATTWDDLIVDTGTPTYLDSDTLTPTLSQVWVKSVMRSFLNLAPMVVDFGEPARDGRGDQSYAAGRTLPIAQTELMTSRRTSLRIRVANLANARQLEYLFASGDVLFVHVPAGCPIPGGYYRVDGMTSRRVWQRSDPRYFDVPLIEVAAPGPDIITAQSTWDTVIALYGTWADVVAAVPTWEDLLDLVGDPSEVIVP